MNSTTDNEIYNSLKKIWDKKHLEDELTESAKTAMNLKVENDLKDHFAGLAMQGILASQVHFRGNGASNEYKEATEIARESYVIAIAMLKVREEVNYG